MQLYMIEFHGRTLYGKKESTRCKMASTTKIMTAIVVVENIDNLNKKVKVSSKAAGTGRVKAWTSYK